MVNSNSKVLQQRKTLILKYLEKTVLEKLSLHSLLTVFHYDNENQITL